MTATALITGASGFVGRHLARELERETDWDIIGITRNSTDETGRVQLLSCDLRNADLVQRVLSRYRPNVIFHLAAQSYVPQAQANPRATLENNIFGQLSVLEACRHLQLDPVIVIVGSADVYGYAREEWMPLTEEHPFQPVNPYAVSKVTQDMLAYQYFTSYGLRAIRMRPFNHFGPGQDERFVIGSFARQVAQAEADIIEPTVLTGNLDVSRDFLDVRDVVRAYRLAIEHGIPGEAYNLASGIPRRIGDILQHLIDLAAIDIEIASDPARMRPSDSSLLFGDSSKFRMLTGWEPAYQFGQSLQDTLDYWRGQVRSAPMKDSQA